MGNFSTINFKKWIDENRHLLKPPVGNKQVWTHTGDFIVMVVGGPNERTDYHYNESEEFFYQLEGNMVLRVRDEGKPVDIEIGEGEIFLLPPKVPHSPQREANSVGLVIEKVRQEGMIDGLQWYCPNCNDLVFEERFFMTDIVTQMQPVFEKFYASKALRTCKNCGQVHPAP
ncbi:MAG TPA: 3-hydroxyanthranilate 3,4-dioxygenase [Bacteroidetes bacterium]|nr:3-hydroxyanthranilate 3,4-dioxygenase [Bacteroidota bacterium]